MFGSGYTPVSGRKKFPFSSLICLFLSQLRSTSCEMSRGSDSAVGSHTKSPSLDSVSTGVSLLFHNRTGPFPLLHSTLICLPLRQAIVSISYRGVSYRLGRSRASWRRRRGRPSACEPNLSGLFSFGLPANKHTTIRLDLMKGDHRPPIE